MAADRPTIAHVMHRMYLAGAEVLAADIARRLKDRYRFVFLCLDEIGPLGVQLIEEGFDVVDLERRPGIDWAVPKGIRRAQRQYKIDLYHAHQYTPFFYAALSRRLSTRPGHVFCSPSMADIIRTIAVPSALSRTVFWCVGVTA